MPAAQRAAGGTVHSTWEVSVMVSADGLGGKRRAWNAGVAATLVLLAAGCADSGGHGSTSSATSTDSGTGRASASIDKPTTETSGPDVSGGPASAADARRRATSAYLGMWHDMAVAARASDWDSPLLAKHATGEALGAITRGMYADRRNGLVTKGAPRNTPKVNWVKPAAEPAAVRISDCGDSSRWLKYRKRTGELADERPGGRQKITAEVRKQDGGTWKVTRFAVDGVGTC
ncbi:hypothetical protein [Streptomyces sp. NPDC102360]|uniref:hypothetical protein n=1 Tax=Streptomyces sp. NPDC102360 TaxID=3366160 RepID=UPI0038146589